MVGIIIGAAFALLILLLIVGAILGWFGDSCYSMTDEAESCGDLLDREEEVHTERDRARAKWERKWRDFDYSVEYVRGIISAASRENFRAIEGNDVHHELLMTVLHDQEHFTEIVEAVRECGMAKRDEDYARAKEMDLKLKLVKRRGEEKRKKESEAEHV